jgi:hypothetical protein
MTAVLSENFSSCAVKQSTKNYILTKGETEENTFLWQHL